jgi:hypothetical protein
VAESLRRTLVNPIDFLCAGFFKGRRLGSSPKAQVSDESNVRNQFHHVAFCESGTMGRRSTEVDLLG